MSSSKIQLKPVGKLPQSTKNLLKLKRVSFDPERQADKFDGEITPALRFSDEDKEKQPLLGKKFQVGKRKRQEDHEFTFKLIEDPRESEFSYRKYLVMEKILLILSIFSFFVAVVNTEMYVIEQTSNSSYAVTSEVDKISSLTTLLLSKKYLIFIVLVTLIRHVCINELEIDQKKFYCIRTGHGIFYEIYRFFKQGESVKYFLIEFFLILPHPFFLFHNIEIQILETYDNLLLKHRLNDLLTIASLSRIYIVMRSILNLTLYSTPRASRVCTHNRVQHSLLYTVKCLLKQEPVKIIALVFLINEVALGFGLRLSEGSLVYNNPQISLTGFQNYINCYWCIFITMATVGYGDYYPKTMPGRLVGLFAAASGIILSSLLIVSLSAYLTMQANQAKSHLTLIRLQHQQRLKEEASEALIETMRMTKYLASQQKENDHKIKDFFTTLKQKIDSVKFRSRKIKSLVNNSNIFEEMSRLFQLFKDNLQQSFRNQVQMKDSLEKMNRTSITERKMQTIFLTHNMEEIISKKL